MRSPERLLPVILKLIVLAILFIVAVAWIFNSFFTFFGPNIGVSPDFDSETRIKELDRVSSFGSFLANLFRGNFGVSFNTRRPASEELSLQLNTTLLLTGLSILFSVLAGLGLVKFLSVISEPKQQKPSTCVHSNLGFFFGATPLVASLFMLFFAYYLNMNFNLQLFPTGGITNMPPPSNPLTYISDVLWHLTLPVAVIVLINTGRLLLVIRSSGQRFSSKKPLKRLVFPIAASSFAHIISAVVVIEYMFALPGLGRSLLTSLMRNDIPVIMASFIALVGIGICLGFASLLLDLAQRLTGLDDELGGKIVKQSVIGTHVRQTWSFRRHLRLFLKRKSLVFSVAMLIAFASLAIFAPLITPYDPLRQVPVAQSYAKPDWMTLDPEYRELLKSKRISPLWDVEKGHEHVSGTFPHSNVDVLYQAGNVETINVKLNSNFSFQGIPPDGFVLSFTWEANEVQETEYGPKLSLSAPGGLSYDLWIPQPSSHNLVQVVHLHSNDPLFRHLTGFQPQTNPAPVIFSSWGEYTISLDIDFRSTSDSSARCRLRLTDAELTILGQVHGILGTNHLGADIFTQLVYGARTVLLFVFPLAFLALILSLPLGFFSVHFDGWFDIITASLTDSLLYLPILPILLVASLFSRSLLMLLFPLLLLLLPLTAKAFRSTFLIRSANQKLLGKTTINIIANLFRDFCANFCLTTVSLVMLLLNIEFLGFGDPRIPSWGRTLHQAFGFGAFTRFAWWWILPPAFFIVLFSLSLLLAGTSLDYLHVPEHEEARSRFLQDVARSREVIGDFEKKYGIKIRPASTLEEVMRRLGIEKTDD